MKLEEPYILKNYDDVVFVYKPPKWNCTTGQGYIEVKDKYDNLILDWINKNVKTDDEIKTIKYDFGLLNRLDLETSGIVMVAKNIKAHKLYRKNINDHIKTTKIYLCVVNGDIKHEFGIIELPLYTDPVLRRTVVDKKKGKFSYTEYVKLQTLTYQNEIYSLLLVKIKTGRTHQIRVHLSAIGHGLVCDKTYEKNAAKLEKQCSLSKRLFLHAQYYQIEDDVAGYAKIPQDLNNTLNKMKMTEKFIEYSNAFDILKSKTITNLFLKK